MSYLLRINNAGDWTNSLVSDATEMETAVSLEYATNANVRVYLYELITTLAAPKPLAVFRDFDPADETHVIFYVQSISGKPLFSFDFFVVEA